MCAHSSKIERKYSEKNYNYNTLSNHIDKKTELENKFNKKYLKIQKK